jgi:phospholipid transport system transporter-binding protein
MKSGQTIVATGDSSYRILGEMTFGTARQLHRESERLFAGEQMLTLDLSQVNRADSAGLALLLEWRAWMQAVDGSLCVKGLPESILAIAQLCQVQISLEGLC